MQLVNDHVSQSLIVNATHECWPVQGYPRYTGVQELSAHWCESCLEETVACGLEGINAGEWNAKSCVRTPNQRIQFADHGFPHLSGFGKSGVMIAQGPWSCEMGSRDH